MGRQSYAAGISCASLMSIGNGNGDGAALGHDALRSMVRVASHVMVMVNVIISTWNDRLTRAVGAMPHSLLEADPGCTSLGLATTAR